MLFQPFYKRKIGSSIKKSEVYFELLKKAQEQGKQVQKNAQMGSVGKRI